MIILSRSGRIVSEQPVYRLLTWIWYKTLFALFALPLAISEVVLLTPPAHAAPSTREPLFRYFAATGHNLSGQFKAFYDRNGGEAIFGQPITEVVGDSDVPVQYFERARFEYHPELAPSDVQISPLGRAYVQRIGIPAQLLAPAPPIATLAEVTITIPASAQHNVALAARQFDGMEIASGAVLSFLNAVGEVSAKTGYEPGQAIVEGAVGSSVGGGICYVSTALYRVAFLAGLDIVERHPHSLALRSLRDMPGFDAAVDTRGPDLRWRNDTPHPILVSAELSGATLTVALWGQGDGRMTTLRGPTVRRAPGAQLTTMSRVVVDANGKIIRSDIVQSRYAVIRTTARTDGRSARN